jgi:hypothetical protein
VAEQCPQCRNDLKVTNLRFVSDIGSADVYQLQDLFCDNHRCPNYAGVNATNPLKVVTTLRNKVN